MLYTKLCRKLFCIKNKYIHVGRIKMGALFLCVLSVCSPPQSPMGVLF